MRPHNLFSRLLVGAVLLAGLSGCATPPKPIVPSGWFRAPANSSQNVAYFEAAGRKHDTQQVYRNALESQVDRLHRENFHLREQLVLQPPKRVIPAVIAPRPTVIDQQIRAIAADDGTFTITVESPHTSSAFDLSKDQIRTLRQACKLARGVVIRPFAMTGYKLSAQGAKARAEVMRRLISDTSPKISIKPIQLVDYPHQAAKTILVLEGVSQEDYSIIQAQE